MKKLEKADVVLALLNSGKNGLMPSLEVRDPQDFITLIYDTLGEKAPEESTHAEFLADCGRFAAFGVNRFADQIVAACNGPESQ